MINSVYLKEILECLDDFCISPTKAQIEDIKSSVTETEADRKKMMLIKEKLK